MLDLAGGLAWVVIPYLLKTCSANIKRYKIKSFTEESVHPWFLLEFVGVGWKAGLGSLLATAMLN